MAQGFIPTACTGCFQTYSFWMDTLLSLDIGGRDGGPWTFPKAMCLTLFEEMDWWVDEGMGRGQGVETGIGSKMKTACFRL